VQLDVAAEHKQNFCNSRGLVPIVALNSVDKEDGSISIIRIDPPLQRKLGWIELKGIKRAPRVQTFFSYLVDHLRKQDLVLSLI
jgi:hypothetical protein